MTDLMIFIAIGFVAQIINGSLGMSYGTLSVAMLLTMGVHPVIASTSVHISKAVTGYASGISHWKLGNVDQELAFKLIFGGVAGGIVGAFVLMMMPDRLLTPLIAFYLLSTGLTICFRSLSKSVIKYADVEALSLGALGGFVDAVGGGGWGPVVTSTLLSKGHNPHRAIGSVSFAEAFVATAITVVLLSHVSFASMNWSLVVGLMIGGVGAAPLAAYLCDKLPVQRLSFAVGTLVVLLSVTMLGGILL
ncbi:MAG: sulfite exporter TauE/SafE family protein [Chloroflexota bacterium]